ncbi:hypothetical protein LCGC14_1451710 [marine sediment metagenome]|uniref:Uncharacterized protein n=1 Tax=marine sediment metagenome TaxID=412755 RepID=A0A0F9LYD3_9ZZZZ
MSQADWNTTDRVLYGIMCSGIALWAIATFIEACRTRPKVQMMVLSIKQPAIPGPDESDESSSAAE